jgi:SAM-dependent methyltransferase
MKPLQFLTNRQLTTASNKTLNDYQQGATQFWEGTRHHDVSQNIDALLRNIRSEPPFKILDFGCGPGRDLLTLTKLGHHPTGIDGCQAFVEMAKEKTGCDVWHQDFLNLHLPDSTFDGIFANASMFHIPTQELHRVLRQLYACLKPDGVLFCSNPRGPDIERFTGGRYGTFLERETWCAYLLGAGFSELEHYYRPQGRPRTEQPWLATLWRRSILTECSSVEFV